MKNIIAFILIALIFASCKPCDPSTWESRTKFRSNKSYGLRQWMKQDAAGNWIVTTIRGHKKYRKDVFECKPDSFQLSQL